MKPKAKTKKATVVPIDQLEVLENRHKLREYCKQNDIVQPEYKASEQFAQISLWAMKFNKFPMCLKTSANLSDNKSIFVLKAYRELPEFFEAIQTNNNNCEVIIEEFVEGKARIEVTVFKGRIVLISQVSLLKSMKLKQNWRAFPLRLPESIYKKVCDIIGKFDKLITNETEFLRFSFVIKNAEPILISINKDQNRLEYLDEWRVVSGLASISESVYPYATDIINKINIYYKVKNDKIDFDMAAKTAATSKTKWSIINNRLYMMLSSNDPKALAQDFEKVDATVKQLLNEN